MFARVDEADDVDGTSRKAMFLALSDRSEIAGATVLVENVVGTRAHKHARNEFQRVVFVRRVTKPRTCRVLPLNAEIIPTVTATLVGALRRSKGVQFTRRLTFECKS